MRRAKKIPHIPAILLFSGFLIVILGACGGGSTNSSTINSKTPASTQVLRFPNVGINDIAVLDPAQGPDGNSAVVVNMLYSGLVRTDKSLNVIPDQATWQISSDNKVYTFKIRSGVTFSDGTPVTAQSYIYTWTRALLPATASPIASFFEASIVGSDAIAAGKAQTLPGIKAIDDHTLQVTLKQATPYFLEELTNSLFYPLNQHLIEQYGKNWTQHVEGTGVGTGPFMVKTWQHTVRMILVPNPHYYGNKTRLTEVDMYIVNSPATAFKAYRAGQYDFVWNIGPDDQVTAKTVAGFVRTPLLQTDLLFFDNTRPPFNKAAVRQAFAYATDRDTLVHAVFKDAVTPAPTIIPPGMPGYQPTYSGLAHNAAKAKALLQSVYSDVTKVPPITFSYPGSQVSANEAAVLQQMWQNALGVQVTLRSVELSAYNDETAKRQVQFGFTQWGADFPDPYDWLYLNLLSTASNNNGTWNSPAFDQTVKQAEATSGNARIALYNKAEQLAISDVGWLPLDHQAQAAIIPVWAQGISLNGNGLYFGDWSNVYIGQH